MSDDINLKGTVLKPDAGVQDFVNIDTVADVSPTLALAKRSMPATVFNLGTMSFSSTKSAGK